MNGYQSNFAQPAYSPSMQSKGKEPVMEQFDEAAFERAFDMAKEDMMADVAPVSAVDDAQMNQEVESMSAAKAEESHQLNQQDVEQSLSDLHHPLDSNEHALPEGMIREEHKEPEQNTRNDDDALAATAQELLEKVENNQTDKFRNSQFLGLMRRLRDREVKVEGDKMVETVSGTQTQTQTAPKRTLTPDSGYDSGTSTPLSNSTTNPAHNPTLCKTAHCDVLEDHRWDHWESPYS